LQNNSRQVIVCSDLDDLSRRAAAHFVDSANRCVRQSGRFTVCLSGGSTPRRTYSLLGENVFSDSIPWPSVHIFWGDERVIPLDRPDNHFRLASDLFLDKVPIPAANIHRARVELGDAHQAADDYQQDLSDFFSLAGPQLPRFDLILLGMGADGHMASLFPGTSALSVSDRLVAANFVPKMNANRLTLTLPVLNNAREIMFLVSGTNKAEALGAVLRDEINDLDLPARRLNPQDGQVRWMVDKDAAAQLQSAIITEAIPE
jgi:6-phosphogluconolactonase